MTRRKRRRSSPALRCLQLAGTLGVLVAAALVWTEIARLIGAR